MRKKTIKGWVLKLRKDGVRKRFLRWVIKKLLPHHHLAHNPIGSGRKKKVKSIEADYKMEVIDETP